MKNLLQGNFIGTDVTGLSPLGNGREGVWILSFATGNFVGGEEPGAGNVIAYNLGNGVNIRDDSLQNAILSNSIFSNGGLGIDLNGDGVTSNDIDPLDADTGGNNLQNFPVIRSAVVSKGETALQGDLNSLPQTAIHLEFFSNDACHPSGNGEGQVFLGATDLTTDDGGKASFELTLPGGASDFVTATATDPQQNTSEFSACAAVLHLVDTPPSSSPTNDPAGTGVQNGIGSGPGAGSIEGAGCSLIKEGNRFSPLSVFMPWVAMAWMAWRRRGRFR
jgi:hypothetical protein